MCEDNLYQLRLFVFSCEDVMFKMSEEQLFQYSLSLTIMTLTNIHMTMIMSKMSIVVMLAKKTMYPLAPSSVAMEKCQEL